MDRSLKISLVYAWTRRILVSLLSCLIFTLSNPLFSALPADQYLKIETDMISVFKSISPYVVNINANPTSSSVVRTGSNASRYRGSGFLWNQKGYIVTNYHVIEKGRHFNVKFSKSNIVKARLIGFDKRNDIAVLRLVSTKTLPGNLKQQSIQLGQSSSLQVGQLAIAIGNPYGLDKSMTTGVISALRRYISQSGRWSDQGLIQTDASVNPGNSGGPLLDSRGRLIGMNTMIVSNTKSSSGIAFAIPVDTLRSAVTQIIRYGKVIRPSLGIVLLSDDVATSTTIPGVIIQAVRPGSPAQKAGLKGLTRRNGTLRLGDVVVGLDGYRINNALEYHHVIEKKSVGSQIKVTFYRKGKVYAANLKLVADS